MTGQGGVGSPIKGMICKIYPVREGDTMPYEQIAETGNFPWYEKVASPRQDEIDRFRALVAEAKRASARLDNIVFAQDAEASAYAAVKIVAATVVNGATAINL